MSTMRGLWLEDRILSFRANIPVPEPGPGEALLRVRLAGICGTDLEMVRGYYPFAGVPGHEFVAEVAATGDPADSAWLGQRVVGEINLVCGECEQCLNGRSTHCEQRTTLGIHARDGVFAEYVTLPVRNLHRVPINVPDESAVFTEPLAAALEILQQIQVHPEDRVLLIGAGRLGQLVAPVLMRTGCDLRVVGRYPQQIALLSAQNIEAGFAEDLSDRSFDIVVEATGSPAGFDLARRVIRPRGTIVLKSTYHGKIQADFSELVVREITVIGSRCGPFEPALRLLSTGSVDPRPITAARFRVDQGLEAFSKAGLPGTLKVLLEL
ncbi:MAG: alcohol dehydrogenase catalytic domain-containing protein [Anaerolineales bacterium]|nr:alcohol dehydrogenase catalytic domain-containing protein [Anaerolineales bacterium]